MRILITGATGHSGLFFLEHLNKESLGIDNVRCLVRNTTDLSVLSKFNNLNFEIYTGDIRDTDFVDEASQDVDIVLNIANIRFTPNLVESALKKSVHWVIAIHTTGRYSKFKAASAEYVSIEDKLLKERKVNLTILRPTMIYGSLKDRNMSKLINFLDKTKFFPVFGDGSNLLQPVTAQDLGKAYFDVIKHKRITINKEYNLPGANQVKYEDIIHTISNFLGKKVYLIKIPIKISYGIIKSANKILPKFPINPEQVLRMQEDKVFSYQNAKDDFGYEPVLFEDGVMIEVEEYVKSKDAKNDKKRI